MILCFSMTSLAMAPCCRFTQQELDDLSTGLQKSRRPNTVSAYGNHIKKFHVSDGAMSSLPADFITHVASKAVDMS